MSDNYHDILKIKSTLVDMFIVLKEIKELLEAKDVPTKREGK